MELGAAFQLSISLEKLHNIFEAQLTGHCYLTLLRFVILVLNSKVDSFFERNILEQDIGKVETESVIVVQYLHKEGTVGHGLSVEFAAYCLKL